MPLGAFLVEMGTSFFILYVQQILLNDVCFKPEVLRAPEVGNFCDFNKARIYKHVLRTFPSRVFELGTYRLMNGVQIGHR